MSCTRCKEVEDQKHQALAAVSSTAATVVTAIERIEQLSAVVDKAIAWREALEATNGKTYPGTSVEALKAYFQSSRDLREAVDAYKIILSRRS